MIKLRIKILKKLAVKEKHLLKVTNNPDALWRTLVINEYIDNDGILQEKFFELTNASQLKIEESFSAKKEKIFNILKMSHTKLVVLEWVESILIALLLALFIRTFFIQAFKIPSGSMRMTLIEGDRLMVNKLRYGPHIPLTDKRLPGFTKPKRGDIIVFIFPEDPKRDFIKRLIATGGETVEIKDGHIYINGVLSKEPRIKNIYYYNRNSSFGEAHQVVKVPPGNYFVLGDNSASSLDSRFWGFVPEKNLIGRAEFIYWPLNRIRFLE